MTKFQVGDKVRVLDVHKILGGSAHYYNGMETEVVRMFEGVDGIFYPQLRAKHGGAGVIVHSKEYDAIELIENNPNQRISALEKKVEELQAQIDELKQSKEVAEDIWDFPPQLTTNQKRAAIIEKAKKFVENSLQRNYTRLQGYDPSVWLTTDEGLFRINHKVEFVVNEKKRTVVTLVKFLGSGRLVYKGIAKCYPDDVFNEHIGKAIALGRALGLDVSEFEQAVQPDEVVVGMQAVVTGKISEYTTTVCESDEGLKKNENSLGFIKANPWFLKRVTNDTDAVYN